MVGRALLILRTSPSDRSESSAKDATPSCPEPLDHRRQKIRQFSKCNTTKYTKYYLDFSVDSVVLMLFVVLQTIITHLCVSEGESVGPTPSGSVNTCSV